VEVVLDGTQLELSCSIERLLADAYLVRVAGEVDLFSAPRLEEVLGGLVDDGAAHLVLDLSGVPFLDSTGLGVLLAFAARLGRESFAVTGLGIESRRVIEITGADRVITVVEGPRAVPA
jgi:anti-sigma B factor antagonist